MTIVEDILKKQQKSFFADLLSLIEIHRLDKKCNASSVEIAVYLCTQIDMLISFSDIDDLKNKINVKTQVEIWGGDNEVPIRVHSDN